MEKHWHLVEASGRSHGVWTADTAEDALFRLAEAGDDFDEDGLEAREVTAAEGARLALSRVVDGGPGAFARLRALHAVDRLGADVCEIDGLDRAELIELAHLLVSALATVAGEDCR